MYVVPAFAAAAALVGEIEQCPPAVIPFIVILSEVDDVVRNETWKYAAPPPAVLALSG
jgi:hypothetical protein